MLVVLMLLGELLAELLLRRRWRQGELLMMMLHVLWVIGVVLWGWGRGSAWSL